MPLSGVWVPWTAALSGDRTTTGKNMPTDNTLLRRLLGIASTSNPDSIWPQAENNILLQRLVAIFRNAASSSGITTLPDYSSSGNQTVDVSVFPSWQKVTVDNGNLIRFVLSTSGAKEGQTFSVNLDLINGEFQVFNDTIAGTQLFQALNTDAKAGLVFIFDSTGAWVPYGPNIVYETTPVPDSSVIDIDVSRNISDGEGSPIYSFVDSKSNTFTFAGTNQPVIVAGAVNGKKSLQFDGTAAYSCPDVAMGLDFMVLAVVKTVDPGVFLACNGTGQFAALRGDTGNPCCYDGVNLPDATLDSPATSWTLLEYISNAGVVTFYQNGVELTPIDPAVLDNSTDQLVAANVLFSYATSAGFCNGELAAIKAFNVYDTSKQLAARAALNNRYNIF